MVNVWHVMRDNLDIARTVLADPNEDLDNKDVAGSTAAELWFTLRRRPDGGAER